MNNNDILILVEKYLDGLASEEEVKLVDNWYESFEQNPGLPELNDEEALELAKKKSFMVIRKRLNL